VAKVKVRVKVKFSLEQATKAHRPLYPPEGPGTRCIGGYPIVSWSHSLRYRLDRWPPLQDNASKLRVLHSPYNLIISPGSDVRSVLPDGQVISSRHAGWGGSGWTDLPCPLQSVCQRHALTFAPRRVSPLGGRHGHHSHVPQADAARQLPGVLPQRPSTVVECMQNRH